MDKLVTDSIALVLRARELGGRIVVSDHSDIILARIVGDNAFAMPVEVDESALKQACRVYNVSLTIRYD